MRSIASWRRLTLPLFAMAGLLAPSSRAQNNNVLSVKAPAKVEARRGAEIAVAIPVDVRTGYHVNSNAPDDEFLIPLKLTWTSGPLQSVGIVYPPASHEKYEFSPKPLSVFTGRFEIMAKLKAPSHAPAGAGTMTGKLRYQACNNRECLPPRTVEVLLPVEVR